ncbi:unnamed protein product [Closterium sp. NIES-64]|nr:unnamed protein product [Closterium sp. NIES-64]
MAVVAVVADADGPVVGTAADPAPAGGSAAAVDGGSASPAATPRAAQAEAEEMRPGAAPEQSAEVALSASPAPVTAAALAAAVSAAIGEHGDAPAEEGATTAAACAGTPAAVVAVSRQEHGQAEGEAPGPASGASSGAARSRSKTRLRAQPAPRRLGAGLGPGSPGPLLGWLLQGQSPSERAHRSSSSNLQERDVVRWAGGRERQQAGGGLSGGSVHGERSEDVGEGHWWGGLRSPRVLAPGGNATTGQEWWKYQRMRDSQQALTITPATQSLCVVKKLILRRCHWKRKLGWPEMPQTRVDEG